MIPILHRERVAVSLVLVEFFGRDSNVGKKLQQVQKERVCGQIREKNSHWGAEV